MYSYKLSHSNDELSIIKSYEKMFQHEVKSAETICKIKKPHIINNIMICFRL